MDGDALTLLWAQQSQPFWLSLKCLDLNHFVDPLILHLVTWNIYCFYDQIPDNVIIFPSASALLSFGCMFWHELWRYSGTFITGRHSDRKSKLATAQMFSVVSSWKKGSHVCGIVNGWSEFGASAFLCGWFKCRQIKLGCYATNGTRYD